MKRYTKKDAERALARLIEALDKKPTKFDRSSEDIGTYYLDYNPYYGGCIIHEVCNEGYGVTTPLGMGRCKPSEFCGQVNFAIRALRAKGGVTTH